MATQGTASARCLSRQELHRSIGMIHSLPMSRGRPDFNPSLGKQATSLRGLSDTDTKTLLIGRGRLGQTPRAVCVVSQGTRAAPSRVTGL